MMGLLPPPRHLRMYHSHRLRFEVGFRVGGEFRRREGMKQIFLAEEWSWIWE